MNEKLVNFIKSYNKINRNETEKLLNVSKTRAYEILSNMCENNLIYKVGSGKSTIYMLK